MACVHTTIADAVTTALNAADMVKSFTATRVYIPELELRDAEDSLVVRVWPAPEGRITSFADRSRKRREYPVFIGIMQKCDVDDNDVLDEYAELLEEIEDLFVGERLTGYTSAVCISSEQVALFSWEAMRQERQYTGVVKLTFLRVA